MSLSNLDRYERIAWVYDLITPLTWVASWHAPSMHYRPENPTSRTPRLNSVPRTLLSSMRYEAPRTMVISSSRDDHEQATRRFRS